MLDAARRRRSAPRSVGGRRHGVRYRAEHRRCRTATGPARGHQRRRRRVPADVAPRCPVGADQDHSAWAEVRPEAPGRAARAGRRVRRARGPHLRAGGDAPAAGPAARRPRRARASTCAAAFPGGDGRASPATPLYDAAAVTGRRRVLPASRRSGRTVDLATGERTDVHREEAPGHDPAALRHRAAYLPRAGRDAGAGDPRAAPRHPAGRHRARAALRLRRLRGRLRAGVGPGAAVACSTAASSSCTPTSAAAARAAGAGGSTAGWTHKQHTFDDLVAVADGLGGDGLVDGDADRDPRAERRRAAPGRGVQPAPGPLAGRGGRGAVRRRGDHDVRRRPSPLTDQRVGGVGRPAGARGVRLDARLLAVRQPAAGRRRAPTCWSPARSTTRG